MEHEEKKQSDQQKPISQRGKALEELKELQASMPKWEIVHPDQQEMMLKRQKCFQNMAEGCMSLEEYYEKNKDSIEIFGNEITFCGNYISIYVQTDYSEYEEYFVIVGNDGKLTVSDVIQWQDNFCANSFLNFHTKEDAEWEDVFDSNDNKTI